VTEVYERLARVETRVDSISEKVDCVDGKLSSMSEKVSDIHTTVVANKTNMSWTKRLLLILLTLFIGAGVTYGYRTISNGAAIASEGHETIEK
jgi:hypothetical protein